MASRVGGVVSETSFKFFVQFVAFTAVYCIFSLIVTAYYFAEYKRKVWNSTYIMNLPHYTQTSRMRLRGLQLDAGSNTAGNGSPVSRPMSCLEQSLFQRRGSYQADFGSQTNTINVHWLVALCL